MADAYFDYSELNIYTISSIALWGIWVTPLFILWCIFLCLARRKGDPARVGLAWVKAVFPFWIVALVFLTIGDALYLWVHLAAGNDDFDSSSDDSDTTIRDIQQAGANVTSIGWLFHYLADILLLVALAELGSGFLLCLGGSTRLRNPVRVAALTSAFILAVLTFAWFGLNVNFNRRYYAQLANQNVSDAFFAQINAAVATLNRLSGAMDILLWIISIPLVAYASYVVHKAKSVLTLRNSAALFLTSTILYFIRLTVSMALDAKYYLPNNGKGNDNDIPAPYVDLTVRPALDSIPMFVLLVLLFTIGIRSQKGLWSTPQPQWPTAGVAGAGAALPPPVIWQGQPPALGQYPQPYYYYPQQPGYPQAAAGYPHQAAPADVTTQQPTQEPKVVA